MVSDALEVPKVDLGDYVRHFLRHGNASSSSADHPFSSPPERCATMRGVFCAIEMPAAPALPAILFASIGEEDGLKFRKFEGWKGD